MKAALPAALPAAKVREPEPINNTEPKTHTHTIKLNLTKDQKLEILKVLECESLTRACQIALTSATGVSFPSPSKRTGAKELLVFDLENTPLYKGKPVDRKTVQELLYVTRAAVHLIVKDIIKDSLAIRQGFVFRLAEQSTDHPKYNHRGSQ